MELNTILLLLLVCGIFAAYVWIKNREVQDADAKCWATASEPFVVISRYHNDQSVSKDAAYIRSMLQKHGNQLLKNPATGGYENAVIEEAFSASTLTTSRDFNVFIDVTLIHALRTREAWRAQKVQWNPNAARQQFAGQTEYKVSTTQH
mgnify:CR=1 FL=1